MGDEVHVREARMEDVPGIRDLFQLIYRGGYPHQGFFDRDWLVRAVYGDDNLMLVAEDTWSGRLLGTASVVYDVGTHSDLIAEFGRLAVHPDARQRGVGSRLMRERVERARERLHAAVVDTRTVHDASQRIARAHGFAPVGFLPLSSLFAERESTALFAGHFNGALKLRRNHPRVVPEVHALADLAMTHCGLEPDAIIDSESAPYPHDDRFEVEDLTAEEMPALLRIERGRVTEREVFGPMRLHYGFFLLRARHASYLIAREPGGGREPGTVAGAIGFVHDEHERAIRVFELIARAEGSTRFLFEHLLERCRDDWRAEWVEVDVSAYAPRLQRTLVELGFLPGAYVPAMVFHQVERLDVVRMVRLLVPPRLGEMALIPEVDALRAVVMRGFQKQSVLPAIARAAAGLELFAGLDDEQSRYVASACDLVELMPGAPLFTAGGAAEEMFLLIEGEAEVREGQPAVSIGRVGPGQTLGERALLTGEAHAAGAVASGGVVAARLSEAELSRLVRRRPDVAVVLYRNLALGLGRKLRAADLRVASD